MEFERRISSPSNPIPIEEEVLLCLGGPKSLILFQRWSDSGLLTRAARTSPHQAESSPGGRSGPWRRASLYSTAPPLFFAGDSQCASSPACCWWPWRWGTRGTFCPASVASPLCIAPNKWSRLLLGFLSHKRSPNGQMKGSLWLIMKLLLVCSFLSARKMTPYSSTTKSSGGWTTATCLRR